MKRLLLFGVFVCCNALPAVAELHFCYGNWVRQPCAGAGKQMSAEEWSRLNGRVGRYLSKSGVIEQFQQDSVLLTDSGISVNTLPYQDYCRLDDVSVEQCKEKLIVFRREHFRDFRRIHHEALRTDFLTRLNDLEQYIKEAEQVVKEDAGD